MIWSFVLAAVGIAGLLLAGSKRKIGWAVGFGAQVLWIVYAIVTEQYGFILSACAYAAVYARNYLQWWAQEVAGELADAQGRPDHGGGRR